MARRVVGAAFTLITCFFSGCGTFASTFSKDKGFGVYSGVRTDVETILAVPEAGQKLLAGEKVDDLGLPILLTMLAVVDLPFSALVDTLLLPRTLPDRR